MSDPEPHPFMSDRGLIGSCTRCGAGPDAAAHAYWRRLRPDEAAAVGRAVAAMTQARRCAEIPVRVERIMHLATIGVPEAMTGETFDLLTDDWAPLLERHLGGDPFAGFPGDYRPSQRELRKALHEALVLKPLLGWVVEVTTPVLVWRSPTQCSYSWSDSVSKAFYGDTYEAALESGCAWAANASPPPS